jgi:hypothetical protein
MLDARGRTNTKPARKKGKRAHPQNLTTDEDLDGPNIANDDDMINHDDYQKHADGMSFKECMEKLRKAASLSLPPRPIPQPCYSTSPESFLITASCRYPLQIPRRQTDPSFVPP